MKLKIIPFIIIIGWTAYSQAQTSITGTVVSENNQPLIGASIYIPSHDIGTITNAQGQYSIQFPTELVDTELDLHISYIGYRTVVKNVSVSHGTLHIQMEPIDYDLEQITIRDKLSQKVVTDQSKSILDFILEEKYIVSLERKKADRTIYLTLYDYQGQERYNLSLHGITKIESLFRSCLGGTYIVARDEVYKFIITKETLILELIEKRVPFDKYTRHCLSANKDYIYTKTYKKKKQQAILTAFNKMTREKTHFGQIMDSLNYVRISDPSELRYIKIRSTNSKSIHTNDPITSQVIRREEAAADFYMRKFHLPINFDFISRAKLVYIINHLDSKIQKYSLNGSPVSLTSLPSFDQKVEYIVDEIYGEIYALESLGKVKDIYSIDLDTGKHLHLGAIQVSFINQVKIRNRILVFTRSGITMQESGKVLNIVNL